MNQPIAVPDHPRIGHVLAVDDEPANLRLLNRILTGAGYIDVELVSDPREVLAAYQHKRPDVVLLDVNMPHLDGYQVLDQLLALGDPLLPPILVVTAQTGREFLMRALEKGARDFVSKPFDRDELLLRVGNAVQAQLARCELYAAQHALRDVNTDLEERVKARTDELQRATEQVRQGFLTSIRAMVNLMELRSPLLRGRGREVARLGRLVATAMGLPEAEAQQVFLAGLLCQVGAVGLPDSVLVKPMSALGPEERVLYRRHPLMGSQALMAIDELHGVAKLIRHQLEHFDGTGTPDARRGEDIPIGARILAVARACVEEGAQVDAAGKLLPITKLPSTVLARRGTHFDPRVIDAMVGVLSPSASASASTRVTAPEEGAIDLTRTLHGRPMQPVVSLTTEQLRPGMELARSLYSRQQVLLLAARQRLTNDMIERLLHYEQSEKQQLSVAVLLPTARP